MHALAPLLTWVYQLSKRKARALLLDLFRLDISLDSIAVCEAEVSRADEKTVGEAQAHF
ncbi:MAG TPA: hypothetical protein PK668_13185 [Myxococcota bacterium]|nr:hypothetical protein [Myxococcota bacterium]HRY93578.1 hypothetical protein [Myxococcota bacterium]